MKSKIILIIIICIFISLPVLVSAQEFAPQVNIPGSNQFTPGEKVEVEPTTFADYLVAIYNWAIKIIIVLAVVMIMVGGFMWMTAGGSSQRVNKAKERITSAIIGLVLALGSYTLLNFINPELVSFKSLSLTNVKTEKYSYKQGICDNQGYLFYIGPGAKCYEINNDEKEILLSLSEIGIEGVNINREEFDRFRVSFGVDGNYIEGCDKENDFQNIETKDENYNISEWSLACLVDGIEGDFCDDYESVGGSGAGIKIAPHFSNGELLGLKIKVGENAFGKASAYLDNIRLYTNRPCAACCITDNGSDFVERMSCNPPSLSNKESLEMGNDIECCEKYTDIDCNNLDRTACQGVYDFCGDKGCIWNENLMKCQSE